MKLLVSPMKRPSAARRFQFSIRNWQIAAPRAHFRTGIVARLQAESGYLLTEALVYIGLIFVLLSVAYAGLYRCIDNCVVLRRNAEDISRAMHAGERWRADVRSASGGIRLETNSAGQILHLSSPQGEISYTARDRAVLRRVEGGPWVSVLKDVEASSMLADVQPEVTGWRWELELQPQTKGNIKAGRIRPLFTFLAAPQAVSNP
jgi:hypothetical protein